MLEQYDRLAVAAMRATSSRRPRPLRGKNPTKNGPCTNPDVATAAVSALGPGTTETGRPSAATARTKSAPGSLMLGIPASVTSAMLCPAMRRPMTRWRLCSGA